MNFKQMLNKLKKGEKVRRRCWDEEEYWQIRSDDQVYWKNGNKPNLNLAQINANDWEVVEDKPKNKPAVVILDNNPISIASYAEEYPENWKKICEALDNED